MLKGSVFLIAEFGFVNKVLKERKKRLFQKVFLLSLLCHIVFVFVLITAPYKKNNELKQQIVEIIDASYVPLPSEDETKVETNETVTQTSAEEKSKSAEKKEQTQENIPEKKEFSLPERKVLDRKRPDTSWRKEVEKKFQAEKPQKISVSRADLEYKKHAPQSINASTSANSQSYIRMLGFMIRNHWYVPEDYGHKFYGLSAELEVSLDTNGYIKNVEVVRSSGNGLFDNYAKEAVIKTVRFPLPPKEMFENIFLNGKITVEFKP